MTKLKTLAFVLLLIGPASSFALLEKTPSPFRRFCEELLISTGLYRPETRALIVKEGYEAKTINDHYVVVKLPVQPEKSIYTYTNRNAYDLRDQMIYPSAFLDPKNLRGKKVVDLACGEGQLVEDLRRAGVDAIGLDVLLTPYQKTKGYFTQASIDKTPFEDNSIDILMSSMGPIRYNLHDRNLIVRTLNEARRILKVGGVFRISPLELDDIIRMPPEMDPREDNERHYQNVQRLFAASGARPEVDLPLTGLWPLPAGWKIKSYPDHIWFSASSDGQTRGPYYWLELERVD